MTQRNTTVDIARGIGIILVVLGHNWTVLQERGELFRVIYSFHLPLFFFLSGLFFRDAEPLGKFALARADALLKPYFVVLVLLGLFMVLNPVATSTSRIAPFAYFSGVIYATAPTIAWAPLWFLPHLFVASVVSMAILRATLAARHRRAWIFMIASALLLMGIWWIGRFWQIDTESLSFMGLKQLPGLPWSLDLTFISAAFILAGFLLRTQVAAMHFSALGFLASAIVFTSLHYGFDETMDLNLRSYGNALVSTLQAALGIYLVLCGSALLQRYAVLRRPLTYIGAGSLLILVFHAVAQGRAFLVLSRFSQNDYLVGAASLAAGVLLPLLVLEIAKRQRLLAALLLLLPLPRKSSPLVPPQLSETHP
jgi:polysaccharide biosynthesis protein PslL